MWVGLLIHDHGCNSMDAIPVIFPNLWREILAWAYQMRKNAGCACAGNAGNVFPHRRLQRKQLVSDPGMHHGTCVTHVLWCMSGSLTSGDGKMFSAFPAHAHPHFYVSDNRPIDRKQDWTLRKSCTVNNMTTMVQKSNLELPNNC